MSRTTVAGRMMGEFIRLRPWYQRDAVDWQRSVDDAV